MEEAESDTAPSGNEEQSRGGTKRANMSQVRQNTSNQTETPIEQQDTNIPCVGAGTNEQDNNESQPAEATSSSTENNDDQPTSRDDHEDGLFQQIFGDENNQNGGQNNQSREQENQNEARAEQHGGNDDRNPRVENTGSSQASSAHDRITVTVTNSDGNNSFFSIRRTTPMKKIFNNYYATTGATRGTLRFLFDGNIVRPNDTPQLLDMVEGDIIEVHLEQVGGYETCE